MLRTLATVENQQQGFGSSSHIPEPSFRAMVDNAFSDCNLRKRGRPDETDEQEPEMNRG